MVDASMYLQAYITVGGSLLGIWGLVKVLKDIKKTNDDEVKRRKRWDDTAQTVSEKADAWDKGLADIDDMRTSMMERYDGRLDNQDAKFQQLYAMQCMSLRAQDAILEALVEQNIGNGDIKAMHKELRDFILDQVQ